MTASPCLVRQNFPSSLFRGLSFKFFAWIQKTDMKPCAHTETCYLCQFAPTYGIIGNTDQSFRLTAEIPNFNEFQACQGQLIHESSRHIYRRCELVACMGTTSGPTAWIDLPFWNLHLGQRIRARTAEQARKEDVKCPAQHHTTIVNPPSVQKPAQLRGI